MPTPRAKKRTSDNDRDIDDMLNDINAVESPSCEPTNEELEAAFATRLKKFDWITERLQKNENLRGYEQTHSSHNRDGDQRPKATTYTERLVERRKQVSEKGIPGSSTGLASLDDAIGGQQSVMIIAGMTQTGKTSLTTQISLNALRADPHLAVLYYSLDDLSCDDLMDQIMCAEAQVDRDTYLSPNLTSDEQAAIVQAGEWLDEQILPRFVILDKKRSYKDEFSADALFRDAVTLISRTRARRVLTVIDMFDDMPLPIANPDAAPHYRNYIARCQADPDLWRLEQIKRFREATCLDCDGGWPLILVFKLRKPVASHTNPTVADLLGAVQFGNLAKQILLLQPQGDIDPRTMQVPMTLHVEKARHGSCREIPVQFQYKQFRFVEPIAASNGSRTSPNRGNGKQRGSPIAPARDALAGLSEQ